MVRVTGEWEKNIIMNKHSHTDMPVGKIRKVRDFLPPPESLFADEKVRVTVYLSKQSVDFFKGQAIKYHTKYQRMIRRLLDQYVARQPKYHLKNS